MVRLRKCLAVFERSSCHVSTSFACDQRSVCGIGRSSAGGDTILYHDAFPNGTSVCSVALDGTSPATTSGLYGTTSVTWTAPGWYTNGGVANLYGAYDSAWLPFAPQASHVYTLSVVAPVPSHVQLCIIKLRSIQSYTQSSGQHVYISVSGERRQETSLPAIANLLDQRDKRFCCCSSRRSRKTPHFQVVAIIAVANQV